MYLKLIVGSECLNYCFHIKYFLLPIIIFGGGEALNGFTVISRIEYFSLPLLQWDPVKGLIHYALDCG